MSTTVIEGLFAVVAGLGGVVLLLMPGYITQRVAARGYRGPQLSQHEFVAVTAMGGVVVHAVALYWTVRLGASVVDDVLAGSLRDDSYLQLLLWAVIVLFVAPCILGRTLAWLSGHSAPAPIRKFLAVAGLSLAARTREAWTWAFTASQDDQSGRWLRVHLKDPDGYVVGRFARRSLASSDYETRDLFLEEVWSLGPEGELAGAIPNGAGMWISGDRIAAIEFFLPTAEDGRTSTGSGDETEMESEGEANGSTTIGPTE